MPPMTHNTKVVYPYEKEEQEKLVAAFTEQKETSTASVMDGELFFFWRLGFEQVKLWRWNGTILT